MGDYFDADDYADIQVDKPYCKYSDLPKIMCAHCQGHKVSEKTNEMSWFYGK